MKKLFVSAGLAAVGAAGIQQAFGQGLDLVSPKAWSVSATLRGFYDDNYNISATKKGSFGGEISPTISYNLPLQQTDMGIRYIYGLYYYNDRDELGLNPFDQTHQVDVWLDHAINERWHLKFTDTVAVGQEPELLQSNPALPQAVPYRVNGDNLANHANIELDTQWTKLFSTSLHYGNDYYDYDDSGALAVPAPFTPGTYQVLPRTSPPDMAGFSGLSGTGASLAGLLNRDEENIGLDLQWTLSPETMLFLGYTFSWVNYIGNEPIAVFNYLNPSHAPQSLIYYSNSRDSLTHQAHVGFSHQFTANISAMVSVGASYTDNYNDPLNDTASIAPYASATVSYTYIPGSYVQLGLSQGQNSTDVVQPGVGGNITQYQNTTVVYADLNHRITEKLTGTVIGRFSYSTFEGGASVAGADEDFNVGVNLTYQISQHFSADAGYNYDDLLSGLTGRGYERNRVYLGLGANY